MSPTTDDQERPLISPVGPLGYLLILAQGPPTISTEPTGCSLAFLLVCRPEVGQAY